MKKFLSFLLAITAVFLLVSCSEKEEYGGKVYYSVTNIDQCPETAENRLIGLVLFDGNGKIAYVSGSRNIVDIDDIKFGTYLRQTVICDRENGIICNTSPTEIVFSADEDIKIIEEEIEFPSKDSLAYYYYTKEDENKNVTLKSHSYIKSEDATDMAQVLESYVSSGSLDIETLVNAVYGSSVTKDIYVDNLRLNIPSSLGITTIVLGDKVKKLCPNAFEGLETLQTIDIENVTSIGSAAFRGCKALSTVNLHSSIKSISSYTFKDCVNLTSVTDLEKIDYIGAGAFEGCSKLTVSGSALSFKRIEDSAFKDCTSLSVSEINCTIVGKKAFQGCTSITNLTLGGELQTIPEKAFEGCENLIIEEIPATVSFIGELAFSNTSVEKVFIPSSVINVDYGIFDNCLKLTEVDFEASSLAEDWSEGWLGNTTGVTVNFNQDKNI